jgi:ATP-dependent RNA helicase DDX46/PRP5
VFINILIILHYIRGIYVLPGKKPELGERKLYLQIEGSSDLLVKQAKLEIQRMLDEETIKMGAGHTGGRYSVL